MIIRWRTSGLPATSQIKVQSTRAESRAPHLGGRAWNSSLATSARLPNLSPSLRICKLIMIPPPTPPGIVRTKTESCAKVHGTESTQHTLAFNITTSKANGRGWRLVISEYGTGSKGLPTGLRDRDSPDLTGRTDPSWASVLSQRKVQVNCLHSTHIL